MGVLTPRLLQEYAVEHIFGADLSIPIEFRELLDLAGNHFVGMFPWKFLEGRSARLRPRASITLTGATWTEATLRITKVGAFAGYTHLSADVIEITDGTGATVGTYEIASKFSADVIVLATSIGAAADAQTDIEGTMRNDQIALPSDFDMQQITAYAMTQRLVGMLAFTSDQTMLDLRSFSTASGGGRVGFYALARWVRAAAGGQPVPRLELWPATDSGEEEFVIFYRGGWLVPAEDTSELSIPNWCNLLFLEVFKAVCAGLEEPEGGSVDARLTVLRRGALFTDAVNRDALFQPELGPVENGWLAPGVGALSQYDIPAQLITTVDPVP